MIYSINEGQQAEEYKKRKAAEEAEKNKRSPRLDKTTGAKHGFNPNNPDEDSDDDDLLRAYSTSALVTSELQKRLGKFATNMKDKKAYDDVKKIDGDGAKRIMDAGDRWIRRHPKQWNESCGIFSNVAFI